MYGFTRHDVRTAELCVCVRNEGTPSAFYNFRTTGPYDLAQNYKCKEFLSLTLFCLLNSVEQQKSSMNYTRDKSNSRLNSWKA